MFTNVLVDKMSSPPPGHSQSSASYSSPNYAQAADEWVDDDDMDFEDEDGTEYATGDEIYFAGSDGLEETEYYGAFDPLNPGIGSCGKMLT